jgi:uncharacterized hydrophobic protein (TIGR00271 family)
MGALSSIIRENEFTMEGVATFEAKLFFEGARRRPYLVRFTVLLFLATVIASGGIVADSTATVIGAMIIAPLMIPIMATAAAFIMGSMERAVRSLLLVGAGVGMVIIVSWLIGNLYSGVISYATNTQITGRTSPQITDLVVALASGAAGAFAMSRDDIADSLPGVAISISLVPPLCVAGIALSDGQWEAALGALVLFLTNFLSILLAGGGVLALLGLGRVATRGLRGNARRNAFLVVALGLLLVSVPLAVSSAKVGRETLTEYQMAQIAQRWVSQSEYEVRRIDAEDDEVSVLITGEGNPPPTSALISAIRDQIRRPVVLDLEIEPIQIERVDVQPLDEEA